MKLFSAIVLISLISIAIFGFVAMSHVSAKHLGCLAATASPIDCSGREHSLDLALFHLKVFRGFSLAIATTLITALALVVLALIRPDPMLSASSNFRRSSPEALSPTSNFKNQLISWLRIHYNSPTFDLA